MEAWEIVRDFGLPVLTGVAGWWAGRPKEKADIDTTNVENAKKLFDEYKHLVEMQKLRGQEHENTIAELRGVISTLEGTVNALNDTIDNLKSDNHSCKRALTDIMHERDILLQEVEKLKVLLERKEDEKVISIPDPANLDG